jgi:hypothetical protein
VAAALQSLGKLPADQRAEALAAIRKSLALDLGWEDWERPELVSAAARAAGVVLTPAERYALDHS